MANLESSNARLGDAAGNIITVAYIICRLSSCHLYTTSVIYNVIGVQVSWLYTTSSSRTVRASATSLSYLCFCCRPAALMRYEGFLAEPTCSPVTEVGQIAKTYRARSERVNISKR